MTSTRPYLVRAIREWALDNGLTPQILVDADAEGVTVPDAYVKDGKIVLNIHDQAVNNLELGNDNVSFSARFGSKAIQIDVPIAAVVAIFARENGQGIFFQAEDEPGGDPAAPADTAPANKKSSKRPKLKLVQ